MNMVRHKISCQQFVVPVLNNTGWVFQATNRSPLRGSIHFIEYRVLQTDRPYGTKCSIAVFYLYAFFREPYYFADNIRKFIVN